MQNSEIEQIIVKKANNKARNDFTTSYDEDSPLDFQGAICYLLNEQLNTEYLDAAELYDFLITKLKK